MESNLIYILLAAVVALIGWNVYLTTQLKKKSSKDSEMSEKIEKSGVEGMLREYLTKLNKNEQDVKELFVISEKMSKLLSRAITKVGFTRYNPFGDTGGDQSFSVALLDSKDSGVIISSLHGRGGTRVYSKPLKEGGSEYNITEEERNAIKDAKSVVKQ